MLLRELPYYKAISGQTNYFKPLIFTKEKETLSRFL
jgi:hypothetical protein